MEYRMRKYQIYCFDQNGHRHDYEFAGDLRTLDSALVELQRLNDPEPMENYATTGMWTIESVEVKANEYG